MGARYRYCQVHGLRDFNKYAQPSEFRARWKLLKAFTNEVNENVRIYLDLYSLLLGKYISMGTGRPQRNIIMLKTFGGTSEKKVK